MDTSLTGQFAYETFRLLDTSPTPCAQQYFFPQETAILLVKCDFPYSCSTADKISTDLRCRAASLWQLRYLFFRFYFWYFTLRMSSSWFRLPTDFYRTTSAVLGIVIRSVRLSVCPSIRPYVCHTRALWLIQRNYRRYFYTRRNGDHVIH